MPTRAHRADRPAARPDQEWFGLEGLTEEQLLRQIAATEGKLKALWAEFQSRAGREANSR